MSSNFWARKLAGSQPPAAPQRPSTLPWWMSPRPAPPDQLSGTPFGGEPATGYTGQPEGHHVIQPGEINLRKLESTKQPDHCPDCDSPDYFKPTPSTRKRCFSCGYPLMQSGSGMSSTESSGHGKKGTPARQVSMMTLTNESGRIIGQTAASAGAGGQGNYNPKDTQAGRL